MLLSMAHFTLLDHPNVEMTSFAFLINGCSCNSMLENVSGVEPEKDHGFAELIQFP